MRAAPSDRPLRMSDQPVTMPFSLSIVTDARSGSLFSFPTLSKIRFELPSGNLKRNIAAWSVGAISVSIPFSNSTA